MVKRDPKKDDDPSSSSSSSSSYSSSSSDGRGETTETTESDSTDQSAGDRRLRAGKSTAKLREQNELKAPKFPNVSTLQAFRLDLYDRMALCAQDKPVTKVAKWLQKVEKDKIKMGKLLEPGPGFASLDRKLAVALQAILPKDLEMRVQTDKAAMKKGPLMSGRQVLWHMYRHLRTSPNQTKLYGFRDIAQITGWGDEHKSGFLNFGTVACLRQPATSRSG